MGYMPFFQFNFIIVTQFFEETYNEVLHYVTPLLLCSCPYILLKTPFLSILNRFPALAETDTILNR
jgi:hypothetical protein